MSIQALVAATLTNTTFALSAGADDGVKMGDDVRVVDRVQVRDPASRELLGEVSVPKLKAKVVEVQERLCVARVDETYTSGATMYYKTLTESPELADWKTIFLAPGDIAEISNPPEVPF